jgi:hypothetical protein
VQLTRFIPGVTCGVPGSNNDGASNEGNALGASRRKAIGDGDSVFALFAPAQCPVRRRLRKVSPSSNSVTAYLVPPSDPKS